ncbi:MAG TPA: YlbF family regulator [Gemmatimonadaceae bacterium]|nr:YlbF family regulator [Gemmatimonadaceae bacterium]
MIEDKAKDLGRTIGQSTEYKEVRRASDTLNEDRETVTLLQQMEQLRLDAQRMLQRGERPTEEMEQKLDAQLSQIQSKPSYQRLLVAQENFDKVMSRVNDWILEGIEKGATSSIITL